MTTAIQVSETVLEGFAELTDRVEHVEFFLASAVDRAVLVLEERVGLGPGDVDGGPFHVGLTDCGRQRVLARASERGLALVEAHSHGPLGDPARFSLTDRRGLRAWVPHLRWRLPGRPYGALVIGERTVDGLAWWPAHETAVAVTQVELPERAWVTTGLSYRDWLKEDEDESQRA